MGELYEIRVKGHLDQRWARYFEGMTISLLSTGETVLSGEVMDQASLHGLLSRIRDLGVALLLVKHLGKSADNNQPVIGEGD